MKLNSEHRNLYGLFPILILVLIFLFLTDIIFGSSTLKGDWGSILLHPFTGPEPSRTILWDYRIPKALAGVLAGAGLAISGLKMQTLFQNPLAGPSVLGITSGAGLGVAILLFVFPLLGLSTSEPGVWGIVIASGLGAFVLLLALLGISLRVRNKMILLIAGVLLGQVALALIPLLQGFSSAETLRNYMLWTFAGLGGATWNQLFPFTLFTLLGLGIALVLMKPLNALLFGEQTAGNLGENIKKLRFRILLGTCMLTGAATAFCGPIGFIGILVPHFARLLFRTSNHRIILPACMLLGPSTVLFCDIFSRWGDRVMPLNAVTAFLGGPMVLWILLKKRKLFMGDSN